MGTPWVGHWKWFFAGLATIAALIFIVFLVSVAVRMARDGPLPALKEVWKDRRTWQLLGALTTLAAAAFVLYLQNDGFDL